MQIVVLANARLKEELLATGEPAAEVHWIESSSRWSGFDAADAYIDLLFAPDKERLYTLRSLPKIVLVNSVERLEGEDSERFVRFAGWPTLLRGQLIEAYGPEHLQTEAEKVFAAFHRSVDWLPDEEGLVTPRVISMIIGEAYRALEEGVSSAADIDTAMKMGTNYPYGPFEWAVEIGIDVIRSLLNKMGANAPHYLPASSL